MRAIKEGETVDLREARLMARICASARARLRQVNEDYEGGSTDDGQRLLLVIYPLGDVVYSTLVRDSTPRKI